MPSLVGVLLAVLALHADPLPLATHAAAAVNVAGPGRARAALTSASRPAGARISRPSLPWPGAPKRYFQQKVSYRIEARLDDSAEVLHGRARMRYRNRSPDALGELYFFLYLNAFRPNSAWAQRELKFGERRFQDLPPEAQAFERLIGVRVDGQRVVPTYPLAPDSTVVRIELKHALAPREAVIVDLEWDARPSSLPRRQGRRGRHYDFAHWFPIVAVRDTGGWEVRPLLPQGEFYGEFMDFDVTLDLAGDQVMGATGVPVEGDPGWRRVAADGFADSLFYRRDAYGPAPTVEHLGLLTAEPDSGRRRVRWLARQVHNFAWSTDPSFIYEGGAWHGIPIHVLYEPGDTAWDEGEVVDRTRVALAWLDSIYGPYAWQQITILHKLEGGGTEFPMLVMNGGWSQGLILHEVGHNYTMGILANNEWKEGFLDEGLADFGTDWFWQTHGRPDTWRGPFAEAARWDSARASQPLVTFSADFRDFATYGAMTYTRPSVVYRMLQAYMGDAAFRRGLRLYYERNKLRHVSLPDFQKAMEDAAGSRLGWFFTQWFRTTNRLDYGIAGATVTRLPDGRFRTRVQVVRNGDAWMPVALRVGDVTRRLDSRERAQRVDVITRERPAEAVLDPDGIILDYKRSNNSRKL